MIKSGGSILEQSGSSSSNSKSNSCYEAMSKEDIKKEKENIIVNPRFKTKSELGKPS